MCRFRCSRSTLSEPPCADFVAGAALCEPQSADFVAGAALCEPPCADVVAGAALCEPRCAEFVAGAALCEPPCADFVAGAALVNLHVQISWQAQYKMRFREIADARNAVFFNPIRVAPKLASQALRNDVCETVSGHIRFFSCFLKCRFRGRHSACADFVAGAALCEPPCADFVAGAALCEPPCADRVRHSTL